VSAPITRRQFVVGAGLTGAGLLAGWGCLPWQAKTPRIPRVGLLDPGSQTDSQRNLQWLQQGLREYGWVDHQNLRVDARFANIQDERLHVLATELTQLPVDVLVTVSTLATLAASEVTSTIPIVFATGADPVTRGLATSYPRPGSNITGITVLTAGLSAKRLELLKQAVPGASRIAVLWKQPDTDALEETQRAGEVLALRLHPVEVQGADDLPSTLESTHQWGDDAIVFEPHPLFVATAPLLADFATRRGLPGMSATSPFTRSGGLMSYGPRIADNFQRAAALVDKILRGAKPADIPIEQPMRFDFVVNLKTAQALGITFPNEIMLQVTEVVQ
jgi:putative tryptophan/tyrosine transport system substrate-binding protein